MKMKKILSVFFALCIAGCILFTAAAFASDMPPLYISGDSSSVGAPPSTISGIILPENPGTEITVSQYSSPSTGSGTLQGGPLDGASANTITQYITNYSNALPRIEKDPTSEADREEGTSTSFIARASNATGYQWFAISPATAQSIPIDQVGNQIDGVSFAVTENRGNLLETTLHINSLNQKINGWQFQCRFTNADGQEAWTSRVNVSVKEPEATPTPMPTPTPTPAPTPTPTPAPTPTAVMPSGSSGINNNGTGTVTSGGSSSTNGTGVMSSTTGSGAIMPTSGARVTETGTNSTPEDPIYTSLTGTNGSGITGITTSISSRSYMGAYILAAAALLVILGAIAVMALYMKGKISLGKFEQASDDANGDGDEFYNPDDFKNT